MYNRFHIILGAFIFLIIYLLYQIIVFKIDQFRTDSFTENIITKNNELNNRIDLKESTEKYVSTNAYRTQVAKATQNKNMPWEEIINVISEEDMKRSIEVNTQEVLTEASRNTPVDPTLKMSNPEKWHYLFQKHFSK